MPSVTTATAVPPAVSATPTSLVAPPLQLAVGWAAQPPTGWPVFIIVPAAAGSARTPWTARCASTIGGRRRSGSGTPVTLTGMYLLPYLLPFGLLLRSASVLAVLPCAFLVVFCLFLSPLLSASLGPVLGPTLPAVVLYLPTYLEEGGAAAEEQ